MTLLLERGEGLLCLLPLFEDARLNVVLELLDLDIFVADLVLVLHLLALHFGQPLRQLVPLPANLASLLLRLLQSLLVSHDLLLELALQILNLDSVFFDLLIRVALVLLVLEEFEAGFLPKVDIFAAEFEHLAH